MKCSRCGSTGASRRAWQLSSVCQPHFCKTVSFALIWWDQTVDTCSTWCLLSPPRFLFEGLLCRQLVSSLYWCMGLPHPRCRNSMKLLFVQLSRFSRPVWTEAPPISVPATLNYCHQQICRMCIIFFPQCWWRSSTTWTPVLTPGIFSFYLLPPSYVKPLAITHHFQQSQGYKTLCNNTEGTGKQNDMKW